MFVVGISTLDLILLSKKKKNSGPYSQTPLRKFMTASRRNPTATYCTFFLSILQERKKSYSFKMFLNYIQKLTVTS